MQQWCKKGPQMLVALVSASQRLLLALVLQATQETGVLTDLPIWVHNAVGQPFMPSTSHPSVTQPMEELSNAARAERTVHVSVRSFTMSQQVRRHLVGCWQAQQLHVPAKQQAAQTTRAGEGAQHIGRRSWHVHPAVWHSHAAGSSSTASALSSSSSSSSSSNSSGGGSTDLTTPSMTAALAFAPVPNSEQSRYMVLCELPTQQCCGSLQQQLF
jgi:hypothetical protein